MKVRRVRFLHGHKAGFSRNERGQHEPVVFGADRHFAAILLHDVANRFHAESVPMLIVALGGAQIAFRIFLQPGIVIIFNTDDDKVVLLV